MIKPSSRVDYYILWILPILCKFKYLYFIAHKINCIKKFTSHAQPIAAISRAS